MIAQGAEAIVYYREGDTSVIKARTSIYATLGRALESIVLHNAQIIIVPLFSAIVLKNPNASWLRSF